MAFTWTAKKVDNGELEQVKFTIKSDNKTEKIILLTEHRGGRT